MTQALYNRIDAIESFAADVAHELKNPLTSLRSAVETLPRVKSGPSRDRLLAIMQHDVRRLDRLISDISDASRLDAELARGDAGPVDMAALLRAVVAMAADSPRGNGVALRLTVEAADARAKTPAYVVLGYDSQARPGDHQSDRQRLLVLAAGRRSARRAEPGARRARRRTASPRAIRSSSRSTTTAPASRRTRSSASSSASTPIARSRASARTPGSGFPFRVRSSRRTAGGYGRPIGPPRPRRPRGPPTRARRRGAPRRGRALRHSPAGDRAVRRAAGRLVEPARDARSSSAKAACWLRGPSGRGQELARVGVDRARARSARFSPR